MLKFDSKDSRCLPLPWLFGEKQSYIRKPMQEFSELVPFKFKTKIKTTLVPFLLMLKLLKMFQLLGLTKKEYTGKKQSRDVY